jgi:Tfp pilus assembly protein PilN
VLGLKARRMPPGDERLTIQILRELVQGLPEPPRQAVGLFPAEGILTRTLTLPSQDPAELRAMATYQLEGLLPYSVQDCVVSIKVLGPAGEATRVLAAVAQRPEIERLLAICQGAGLQVTELACSTEAVGRWHQACWPKGLPATAGWLVAEMTPEGLELAVLAGGSLVYMRQVPLAAADAEETTARIEETLQAYQSEKAGPPVQRVTLSGWTQPLTPEGLERMQFQLGLPVHTVDPLEASPFRDMLALAAREVAPEISFSELLGVASAPRMLELDLLPVETRHDQLRAGLFRHLRRTLALLATGLAAVALWAGLKWGTTAVALGEIQAQIQLLQPQVERIRQRVERLRDLSAARAQYSGQMEWIAGAVRHLSPGMSLEFLELQGDRVLTVRGVAPGLDAVTRYAAEMQSDPLWQSVSLRSARQRGEAARVEFEMALFPRKE